ncbi:hypothetical protein CU666_21940 [Pseudomonas syringae pv. actinidifoliorum]|nr:hypothetical protein [Pseudomonas syringae pv. actinidifoliorum]NAT60513.1 hypothetical protein [Pseudomonas syringae pv. actinidifoliorum]
MNINSTRERLIRIIAEHQLAGDGSKLKIADVAVLAGISRQAFSRYYDDLKPYIKGDKKIGELLTSSDDNSLSDFLIKSQARIEELEASLAEQQEEHARLMEKTLNSHITTLMNNDIAFFSANKIRANFESQSLQVDNLGNKIRGLEAELALAKMAGLPAIDAQAPQGNAGKMTVVDIDIASVFKDYAKHKDLEKYTTDKLHLIKATTERVAKLANGENTAIVLFFERYISQFQLFSENYQHHSSQNTLLVRIPLFRRSEYLRFLKAIGTSNEITAYIPSCLSPAEKQAQRNFFARVVPEFELSEADTADPVKLEQGFNRIIQQSIKQGD